MLRLFAFYILFTIAASIGSVISTVVNPEYRTFEMIEYHVFQISIYVLISILLYRYSERIADKVARFIPDKKMKTSWTPVELLTILILAISVFSIIEAIPSFINQLNAAFTSFQNGLNEWTPMRRRFNMILFGLLGASLKIIVSIVSIAKAKTFAAWLIKIQKK